MSVFEEQLTVWQHIFSGALIQFLYFGCSFAEYQFSVVIRREHVLTTAFVTMTLQEMALKQNWRKRQTGSCVAPAQQSGNVEY
jgi:hypothetical protein